MTETRCSTILASGRLVDLTAPAAADYADVEALAEHLAKENRWNGATPGVAYSVAEHLWRGALAAFAETSDRKLAAYFLLHDAAEALLKDDPSPKTAAVIRITDQLFGPAKGAMIANALGELNDRHDRAAHAAFGLSWPVPPAVRMAVREWDHRMARTEWRDLMGDPALPCEAPWRDVEPISDKPIKPLDDWRAAKAMLLAAWHEFMPALGGRAE